MDGSVVFLPVAPLMHAAGQWTSLSWLFAGGTVVLLPGSLDPVEVWQTVEREKVNLMTVVGDPVVARWWTRGTSEGPFDVSSLFSVGIGRRAAVARAAGPARRDRAQRLGRRRLRVVGDRRAGRRSGSSRAPRPAASPRFTAIPRTPPCSTTTRGARSSRARGSSGGWRSGAASRSATTTTPEKTAETFVEVDGERWVLTGDMATVDDDGSIKLLGRGSVCINTGGEKVFPEEVEAVLKGHPAVYDVVVVGVPDERWGQRVAAVVQPSRATRVSLDELARLLPARSWPATRCPARSCWSTRSSARPAGKADYRWAKRMADAV